MGLLVFPQNPKGKGPKFSYVVLFSVVVVHIFFLANPRDSFGVLSLQLSQQFWPQKEATEAATNIRSLRSRRRPPSSVEKSLSFLSAFVNRV